MTAQPVKASVEEAVSALTDQAFRVTDQESPDFGRTLIHTHRGPFGADWDLDAAIVTVREAVTLAWTDNLFGHDLVAIGPDGRTVYFDVRRPGGDS